VLIRGKNKNACDKLDTEKGWSYSGLHSTKAGASEEVDFSYEIISIQVNQQKYVY